MTNRDQPRDEHGRFVATDDDAGGFDFDTNPDANDKEPMTQSESEPPATAETVRRILLNFGKGAYAGFVEWHPIPDSETGIAKLGFVVGFVLKIGIILVFGAEYLPA